MGFGQSPFPVHPSVCEALQKNVDKKNYLSTQGILPLREKIAEFYRVMFNLDFQANQIIIAPGSKALLFASLIALEGAFFLPAPSWVTYTPQAQFLGKEFYFIETQAENSYRLTPTALEEALQRHVSNRTHLKTLLSIIMQAN